MNNKTYYIIRECSIEGSKSIKDIQGVTTSKEYRELRKALKHGTQALRIDYNNIPTEYKELYNI